MDFPPLPFPQTQDRVKLIFYCTYIPYQSSFSPTKYVSFTWSYFSFILYNLIRYFETDRSVKLMYLRVIFSKLLKNFPFPLFLRLSSRSLLAFNVWMHFTRDTERHLALAAVPSISRPIERALYVINQKKWPHSSENQAIRVFLACSAHFYRHLP